MNELKLELKNSIIESLNLENVSPSDINDDAPLFGDGLGLDSIDALELIVLLEKDYGISVSNPEEGQSIFMSIDVMAKYITDNRKK